VVDREHGHVQGRITVSRRLGNEARDGQQAHRIQMVAGSHISPQIVGREGTGVVLGIDIRAGVEKHLRDGNFAMK